MNELKRKNIWSVLGLYVSFLCGCVKIQGFIYSYKKSSGQEGSALRTHVFKICTGLLAKQFITCIQTSPLRLIPKAIFCISCNGRMINKIHPTTTVYVCTFRCWKLISTKILLTIILWPLPSQWWWIRRVKAKLHQEGFYFSANHVDQAYFLAVEYVELRGEKT